MGQCVSKRGNPLKGKKKVRSIPLDTTKTLDQVKMIHYCTEIWPKFKLQGKRPWYGTYDPWICSQLNHYLRTRENPDVEQLMYAACWQAGAVSEGSVKICKLKEKEKEKNESREEVSKKWDPLDYLPPPPFPPIYPVTSQIDNNIDGPWCNTRSKASKPEKMMPLREVPMGGMLGGVGFVNAPLTASEVRSFKKELGNLVEDPVGISNQVDQFLGPNIYTWGELDSILNILFCPEEVRMIRTAGIKIWERENRTGPPGDLKMPLVDPGWNPNHEEGRRNMRDYRSLIIKGIKESVPRSSNTKLAFEGTQEKDEAPASWLNRLRRNFQLYSNIDPDSPEGQVLLKVQFVTKSWPDIRRKLEKIEDWQEKSINELLKEALRVYLRREEEKAKAKARIMVAVARESAGADKDLSARGSPETGQRKPTPSVGRYWEKPGFRKEGEKSRRIEGVPNERACYYCGQVGHFRKECRKLRRDEVIAQEQEALERALRGED
uniref:CCHC-type domain-containing protein n=1 Tax=Serinus canaria TaxID=9135 RepID=A0A8C9NHL8_SERCA